MGTCCGKSAPAGFGGGDIAVDPSTMQPAINNVPEMSDSKMPEDSKDPLYMKRYRPNVELFVSCKYLPAVGGLIKGHHVILLHRRGKDGSKHYLGRTEVAMSSQDPQFQQTFKLYYSFNRPTDLLFELYRNITGVVTTSAKEDDVTGLDYVGGAVATLHNIVSTGKLDIPIRDRTKQGYPAVGQARVMVACEQLSEKVMEKEDIISFSVSGDRLDALDTFGKSDPYLQLYRKLKDTWVLVYTTEVLEKTLQPKWANFTVTLDSLCNGDYECPLRVVCMDYNKLTAHQEIGSFETCLRELVGNPWAKFTLVNEKKSAESRAKHIPYYGSGSITFFQTDVFENSDRYFLNYIRGGMDIRLKIAMDCSQHGALLHKVDANGTNAYLECIQAVTEVAAPYDTDGKISMYGFGCNTDNGLHFFNNGQDVDGQQSIVDTYMAESNKLQMAVDCKLTPLLQHIKSSVSQPFSQRAQHYTILLILISGKIVDWKETVAELVSMGSLPISVVLVGVGNVDMEQMKALDADRHVLEYKGRRAQRDLVQFVPFNRYKDTPARLAEECLGEVTKQVVTFAALNQIVPNQPTKDQPANARWIELDVAIDELRKEAKSVADKRIAHYEQQSTELKNKVNNDSLLFAKKNEVIVSQLTLEYSQKREARKQLFLSALHVIAKQKMEFVQARKAEYVVSVEAYQRQIKEQTLIKFTEDQIAAARSFVEKFPTVEQTVAFQKIQAREREEFLTKLSTEHKLFVAQLQQEYQKKMADAYTAELNQAKMEYEKDLMKLRDEYKGILIERRVPIAEEADAYKHNIFMNHEAVNIQEHSAYIRKLESLARIKGGYIRAAQNVLRLSIDRQRRSATNQSLTTTKSLSDLNTSASAAVQSAEIAMKQQHDQQSQQVHDKSMSQHSSPQSAKDEQSQQPVLMIEGNADVTVMDVKGSRVTVETRNPNGSGGMMPADAQPVMAGVGGSGGSGGPAELGGNSSCDVKMDDSSTETTAVWIVVGYGSGSGGGDAGMGGGPGPETENPATEAAVVSSTGGAGVHGNPNANDDVTVSVPVESGGIATKSESGLPVIQARVISESELTDDVKQTDIYNNPEASLERLHSSSLSAMSTTTVSSSLLPHGPVVNAPLQASVDTDSSSDVSSLSAIPSGINSSALQPSNSVAMMTTTVVTAAEMVPSVTAMDATPNMDQKQADVIIVESETITVPVTVSQPMEEIKSFEPKVQSQVVSQPSVIPVDNTSTSFISSDVTSVVHQPVVMDNAGTISIVAVQPNGSSMNNTPRDMPGVVSPVDVMMPVSAPVIATENVVINSHTHFIDGKLEERVSDDVRIFLREQSEIPLEKLMDEDAKVTFATFHDDSNPYARPVMLNDRTLPLVLDDGMDAIVQDLQLNLYKQFDEVTKHFRDADDWEPLKVDVEGDANMVPIPMRPDQFVEFVPVLPLELVDGKTRVPHDLLLEHYQMVEKKLEETLTEVQVLAAKQNQQFLMHVDQLKKITDEQALKTSEQDIMETSSIMQQYREAVLQRREALVNVLKGLNANKQVQIVELQKQFEAEAKDLLQQKTAQIKDLAEAESKRAAAEAKNFVEGQVPHNRTQTNEFSASLVEKHKAFDSKLQLDYKGSLDAIHFKFQQQMAGIAKVEHDDEIAKYVADLAKLKQDARNALSAKRVVLSEALEAKKLDTDAATIRMQKVHSAYNGALRNLGAKKAFLLRKAQKSYIDTPALQWTSASRGDAVQAPFDLSSADAIDITKSMNEFSGEAAQPADIKEDELIALKIHVAVDNAMPVDAIGSIEKEMNLVRNKIAPQNVAQWDPDMPMVNSPVPALAAQAVFPPAIDYSQIEYLHFTPDYFYQFMRDIPLDVRPLTANVHDMANGIVDQYVKDHEVVWQTAAMRKK